jgi:hypothetical protein
MNFGSLHYFLGIKTIENDLKSPHSAGPKIGLAARSSRGGDPRAARVGRAVVSSPRVGQCGGALTGSLVVGSRWQDLELEHHG